MGIPIGNAYVQRVPASLRFTLSYPTPVQDGKSFSQELQGLKYKRICSKYGEDKVLNILKKDAEKNGTPLTVLLNTLGKPKEKKTVISYTSLNGLYDDGLPWSGIMAKIRFSISDKSWRFNVVTATDRPKLVTEFMKEFVNSTKLNTRVAWNGGYILNPELVGKLGIPERFIGSPLGLIISNGKVLSPPLYSKPAFLVNSNGRLEIKRVKCSKGLIITNGDSKITLGSEVYNLSEPNDDPCFYDMLYQNQAIPGNGRILVRMAGNIIKDIIATDKGQDIPVLPVGLTLSFLQNKFPKSWRENTTLDIRMLGWPDYESAIEAGPQYLNNGKVCIDMEIEGWKTLNSIRTQAARLDYLDSRGPKIAIGLDKNSDLLIITINGRIRESVGATHHDIANIMKSQGIRYAMGFDPGGSSTLVVDGKTLNISPYNHRYEENVYSLPPEPRAVANAVLLSEINGKE
jgi:exopolysaccharide biosynthesis protein